MVSGIEAIGVSLAAFSLLLQCLGFFCDVAEGIHHYKTLLQQFRDNITIQETIFNATIASLELALEQQSEFGRAAKTTPLYSQCVNSIVRICTEMTRTLNKLSLEFEKYQGGGENMLQSLQFTLTDSYRETQLTKIRQLNDNLYKLLFPFCLNLNPRNTNAKVNAVQGLLQLREHVQALHRVLEAMAVSQTQPNGLEDLSGAYLGLAMRYIENLNGSTVVKNSNSDTLRFKVWVSRPSRKWHTLEFEPREDSGLTHRVTENLHAHLVEGQGTGSRSVLQHNLQLSLENAKLMFPSEKPALSFSSVVKALRRISLIEKALGRWRTPLGSHNRNVRSSSSRRVFLKEPHTFSTLQTQSFAADTQTLNIKTPPAMAMAALSPSNVDNPGPASVSSPTKVNNLQVLTSDRFLERLFWDELEIPDCIGTPVRDKSPRNKQKFRVWIQEQLPHFGEVISLNELIPPACQSKFVGKQRAWKPTLSERLKLGVILASSVLQLHGTGWLHPGWSKQDIFFLLDMNSLPNLAHPLARLSSNSIGVPSKPGYCIVNHNFFAKAPATRCDQDLFTLGILLIELWTWKTAENTGDVMGLLEKLRGNPPLSYFNAVKFCFTDLGHSYGNATLDANQFKNSAYEKIMQPLEQTVKGFYGTESFDEIFGT